MTKIIISLTEEADAAIEKFSSDKIKIIEKCFISAGNRSEISSASEVISAPLFIAAFHERQKHDDEEVTFTLNNIPKKTFASVTRLISASDNGKFYITLENNNHETLVLLGQKQSSDSCGEQLACKLHKLSALHQQLSQKTLKEHPEKKKKNGRLAKLLSFFTKKNRVAPAAGSSQNARVYPERNPYVEKKYQPPEGSIYAGEHEPRRFEY